MTGFRLRDRLVLPGLNEIRSAQRAIHIEPKAMSLLLILAQRPFDLVTREEILATVWAGVFVGDAVLTNAISIIRRALGDRPAEARFVQTVPKRGYRLIAPVLPMDVPPQDSELHVGPLLWRARCLRQEETVASVLKARRYAEEITVLHPGSGAGYAELALSHLLLEKLGHTRRSESQPSVLACVDRALSDDKPHVLAYVAAAKAAYIYDWNWNAAERHFMHAIEVDPTDAEARTEFAIMLMNQRRFDEATGHLETAYRLDPLSPSVTAQMGHSHFYQYKMDSAISYYEKLLRLSPEHLFGRWCMAAALEHSGQPHRSRSTIDEGLHLLGLNGIPLLVTLCRVYLLDRDRDSAEGVLDRLLRATSDPLLVAHVLARFGDRQATTRLLEEAADQRHYRITDINALPSFSHLRCDPPFLSLMRSVGLPV